MARDGEHRLGVRAWVPEENALAVRLGWSSGRQRVQVDAKNRRMAGCDCFASCRELRCRYVGKNAMNACSRGILMGRPSLRLFLQSTSYQGLTVRSGSLTPLVTALLPHRNEFEIGIGGYGSVEAGS